MGPAFFGAPAKWAMFGLLLATFGCCLAQLKDPKSGNVGQQVLEQAHDLPNDDGHHIGKAQKKRDDGIAKGNENVDQEPGGGAADAEQNRADEEDVVMPELEVKGHEEGGPAGEGGEPETGGDAQQQNRADESPEEEGGAGQAGTVVEPGPGGDGKPGPGVDPGPGGAGKPGGSTGTGEGGKKPEMTYVLTDGKNCYKGKTWDEAKENRDKKDEAAINGEIVVHDEKSVDTMCMMEYDKRATALGCGTGIYDSVAYCLKVNFFGGKTMDEFKQEMLTEKSNDTTPDAQKQKDMRDYILTIIEGCFVCNAKKEMGKKGEEEEEDVGEGEEGAAMDPNYLKVTLQKLEPQGPIPNFCKERYEKVSELTEHMLSYEKGFIINGIMKERLCPSRADTGKPVEVAPFRYAQGFKLEIEHNCGVGDGGKTKTYVLKSNKNIEVSNLTNNIFELRGLKIELDDKAHMQEDIIYWEPATGIGYDYFKMSEIKKGEIQEGPPITMKPNGKATTTMEDGVETTTLEDVDPDGEETTTTMKPDGKVTTTLKPDGEETTTMMVDDTNNGEKPKDVVPIPKDDPKKKEDQMPKRK